MIGRRTALLVIALLCSALIAACGGSGSSTTNGSTATSTPATTTTAASTPATTTAASTPAATTTAASTPTGTTATTPTLPLSPAEASGVKEYAAICKLIIAREPHLAASTKSKVEGICSKAAAGNLAGARAAAKEVCVEVISASPIPAAQKAKDIASCKLT
jgi:hypothetical protein